MGYSMEVLQRARARLAQAKEDRESENRQHLAEAYARVPRIREIDMELRRTMAQDKDHRYFKCPNCGQQLRVPKGKGKLNITCRNCGVSFEKNT